MYHSISLLSAVTGYEPFSQLQDSAISIAIDSIAAPDTSDRLTRTNDAAERARTTRSTIDPLTPYSTKFDSARVATKSTFLTPRRQILTPDQEAIFTNAGLTQDVRERLPRGRTLSTQEPMAKIEVPHRRA
jgi:hypothetical protein